MSPVECQSNTYVTLGSTESGHVENTLTVFTPQTSFSLYEASTGERTSLGKVSSLPTKSPAPFSEKNGRGTSCFCLCLKV